MYRLGLRLGLGTGNGFYSFFFFSVLKSDEHLCLALLAKLEPGPKSGDNLWQCDVSVTYCDFTLPSRDQFEVLPAPMWISRHFLD